MVKRDGLSQSFKKIRLFLGTEVDEKTAAQKPKKVKISTTPSQFFFIYLSNRKARRLQFSLIDLAKNSAQNPSISEFLEPQGTISEKSKPPILSV